MKKRLIALSMFMFLAACGFEPLYVQKKHDNLWYFGGEFDRSISSEMAQIKVEATGERFGQLIRNELLDMLTPLGVPHKPKYRLVISLENEVVYDQALRNDITATRKRVEYTVGYTMFENGKRNCQRKFGSFRQLRYSGQSVFHDNRSEKGYERFRADYCQ